MGVDRGNAHQEDKMHSFVLAAVLSIDNCEWGECCSWLQHGARPDRRPREPPADRPAAAAGDRGRQALRSSLNLCPVFDSVWTQFNNQGLFSQSHPVPAELKVEKKIKKIL